MGHTTFREAGSFPEGVTRTEETCLHPMRLYARNGERAGALRVCHPCVTLLQREFGVAPGLTASRSLAPLHHRQEGKVVASHKCVAVADE